VTILVTGVRGRIAAHVVTDLLAAGESVRAASGDPDAVELPDAVETVRLDLSAPDPASLAEALHGVDSVFLYSEPRGIASFLDAATDAGVARVVLLSSLSAVRADADASNPNLPPLTEATDPIAWRHVAVERALADSGLPWTFVRPGMFATNSLRWAPAIRSEGAVRLARPGAEATPIHERDIAEVAVRALLEPGHDKQRYSLTGPASLNQRRQVELIGEAIGRPIRLIEITDDEAREQLARWGSPAIADRLIAGLVATDGKPAEPSDTVSRVLGRPARTFAEWAVDHAPDYH
jgi:uncharacterized protein YbjT (DUF2867 family)